MSFIPRMKIAEKLNYYSRSEILFSEHPFNHTFIYFTDRVEHPL